MSRPERGLRPTLVVIDEAVEWRGAEEKAAAVLEAARLPALGEPMHFLDGTPDPSPLPGW